MSTSAYPMTEFEEFLSKRGLGESSRRQVLLAVRRAIRHIGLERLQDRSELKMYRMSVPDATGRLFGYSWPKFREYMALNGEELPELERLPVTKLVHPLWADLTDLTVHLNIHQIEAKRWADIADAGPEIQDPAVRAFEFVTGRPPMNSDWLVPRDADAKDPMPYWMIDTILRTNATEESRDVEYAAFQMLENMTRRGIGATDLRALWDLVTANRDTTKGRRRIIRAVKELNDPSKPWSQIDQERATATLRATVAE